ncbi:MAG: endonuclease III, partial [Rubricoccaceae bacterium]|nr:endonuclease III [Rubricoccaceae bacterium]
MSRRAKARVVLERLRERIPRPETELQYRSPFELLVAVILSAQCTDKRVNLVTPDLFARFPTPEAMAEAEADEIFPYIRSVSYPNQKAKALAATARMLVADFGGEVPRTHAELTRLKGVGRKTANVVVAVAFDEPAIAVDTHVFRVANRIGLVKDAPT